VLVTGFGPLLSGGGEDEGQVAQDSWVTFSRLPAGELALLFHPPGSQVGRRWVEGGWRAGAGQAAIAETGWDACWRAAKNSAFFCQRAEGG